MQERERHVKIRESSGHWPGVPGHPAGQTGVYRPVSQGLPVACSRKSWHFSSQDTGRVSERHPAVQVLFRKILWDFFLCAFSAPYKLITFSATMVHQLLNTALLLNEVSEKVAKFETKFPKISPKFAPKFFPCFPGR